MRKSIAVLCFIVLGGYTIPDVSWADKHVVTTLEGPLPSLTPAEYTELIGPVLSSEGWLQRTEQRSWNCFNLIHTDPHYILSIDQHHPAPYRTLQEPDGAALMFSWPFGGLGNQPISGNANHNRNGEADNLNLR